MTQIIDFPPDTLFYLATPYSQYYGGLEKAHLDACVIVGHFTRQRITVFSPIAYQHPITRTTNLDPLDLGQWLSIDRPFMVAAHVLIVGMLPGWKASEGVRAEIDHFLTARKPILYYDPEEGIFE
jgi:hypothetical protein